MENLVNNVSNTIGIIITIISLLMMFMACILFFGAIVIKEKNIPSFFAWQISTSLSLVFCAFVIQLIWGIFIADSPISKNLSGIFILAIFTLGLQHFAYSKWKKMLSKDIDIIRKKIADTLLQKGKDIESQIVLQDCKIQLKKIIETIVILDEYTILAVGLEYIDDNHNCVHYKVMDNAENIFWTIVEQPCSFESNKYELQKILNTIKS